MKFNRVWLPLNSLRAFEATAKHLSFTKAADELSVTQSAVSRQVLRLEELVGKSMFDRKPRNLILTEVGLQLYQQVKLSFDQLENTLQDIVEGNATISLKLSVATSFANTIFPAILGQFAKLYPEIEIELESAPDKSAVAHKNFDLTIIHAQPTVTSELMDLIWEEEITPLCTPDIAEGLTNKTPQEFLATNTLLHIRTDDQKYHNWEVWSQAAGLDDSNIRHGLTFDSSFSAVRCTLDGGGIVATDKRLYQKELNAGDLVAPFELSCASGFGYYMSYKSDDFSDAAVQLFRNWIIERFLNFD